MVESFGSGVAVSLPCFLRDALAILGERYWTHQTHHHPTSASGSLFVVTGSSVHLECYLDREWPRGTSATSELMLSAALREQACAAFGIDNVRGIKFGRMGNLSSHGALVGGPLPNSCAHFPCDHESRTEPMEGTLIVVARGSAVCSTAVGSGIGCLAVPVALEGMGGMQLHSEFCSARRHQLTGVIIGAVTGASS